MKPAEAMHPDWFGEDIVAGIIDRGGGLRIVCTHPNALHYHVNEGETAYVIPNFTINSDAVAKHTLACGWHFEGMVRQYIEGRQFVPRNDNEITWEFD